MILKICKNISSSYSAKQCKVWLLESALDYPRAYERQVCRIRNLYFFLSANQPQKGFQKSRIRKYNATSLHHSYCFQTGEKRSIFQFLSPTFQ